MATVGAVALAAGLAFGLGGREVAARIWEDWYNKSRAAAPKLAAGATEMSREIDKRTTGPSPNTPTLPRH